MSEVARVPCAAGPVGGDPEEGKWEEAERGWDVGEGDERGEARSYLHTSSH